MSWVARTGIEIRLAALGQDAVLEVEQISGIPRPHRVAFEQIPIHDIAIAMIVARAVNARTDVPGPGAGEAQIVQQIIEILVVDRIRCGWVQHAGGPAGPAENAATVAPAINSLKRLDRLEDNVGTTSLEAGKLHGEQEES